MNVVSDYFNFTECSHDSIISIIVITKAATRDHINITYRGPVKEIGNLSS